MPQQDLFSSTPVWCWHPGRQVQEPGYTLFRRTFSCAEAVEMHLAVSADNRYNIYLDGELLGRGPCRSDLQHYVYEEYRAELASGKHIIAIEVVVWRGGWRHSAAPWSEQHVGGGLMVCGYAGPERLDLPDGWLCKIDEGRRSLKWNEAWKAAILTPIPPMDRVDFRAHDCRWTFSNGSKGWEPLIKIGRVCFRDNCRNDPATPWLLIPRTIKQMREEFTPLERIISISSPIRLLLEKGRLTGKIPPGKHTVIVDIGRNQTSMVTLSGGGGGGGCRIAYAETLFVNGKRSRDIPPHGEIGQSGYADLLILPPTKNWTYRSFWFRTGRFIELELDLKSELNLKELRVDFISYPFSDWMEFHAPGNPVLEKIWETAVHTVKCCAHEHYEDCPYYEQLQYAGDTRIQALISYAATGDDTLGRQALRHFDWSRQPSGLTQSRYPNNFMQTIPQFSLIWILMVHDHYRYFGDKTVIREHWDGITGVLEYFEKCRTPDRLIGCIGSWNVTDWTRDWPSGKSDRGSDGPETITNFFYCEACRMAAELGRIIDLDEQAEYYERQRRITLEAVNRCCWNPLKKRYRDVPDTEWYSIHANMLAILADAVPADEQGEFAKAVVNDPELTQATLYFAFYVLEALKKCGDTANFIRMLTSWEEMLKLGFTTFPEVPSVETRSDCHGWSAGPAYAFITGFLGINPVREGIRSSKTALLPPPHWKVRARMPGALWHDK